MPRLPEYWDQSVIMSVCYPISFEVPLILCRLRNFLKTPNHMNMKLRKGLYCNLKGEMVWPEGLVQDEKEMLFFLVS